MSSLKNRLNGLATLSPAELRAEWRRVYRTPAPALSPDLLTRGIAYRLQERVYGGLSPAVERQLLRIASGDGAPSPAASPDTMLRPGTRLVRSWNVETHQVLVREDGYQLGEHVYASLSAVAFEITGTRWSGPRFFGLKGKGAIRRRGDADAQG